MALAGFTAVGEFHYVHHGPGGVPYDDPNIMGRALIEAAHTAGVRLTLLDACYLEGGFDAPLKGPQRRFGDATAAGWIERVDSLRPGPGSQIGAAIHSVRTVPPLAMAQVAEWAEGRDWRLHAHVSEQRKEQIDCRRHRGTTPIGVLAARPAPSTRALPPCTALSSWTPTSPAWLNAAAAVACAPPPNETSATASVRLRPCIVRASS
jgi:cytosine/adenosine deaminase-related metal-dependent hydrolase